MRITNGMMVSTLRSNINRNMTKMDELQNQMSTGKRINKPSDDPVGVNYSLRLRNNLVENDQYKKNIEDATSFLEATDTALDETGKVLQRIRELTVSAANDTNDATSRNAIRSEIDQLRKHLMSVSNTEFGGKYIFSGTKTDTQAFSGMPETWNGNSSQVNYEIGVGIKIPVNVTADQVYGDNVSNVFQTLANLDADLAAGNSAAISSRITEVDKWLDKTNTARSEVGARTNRLEFSKSRIEDNTINFTELLSKTEDADIAEVITNLKVQENVYKSSLAAGARIVQPSLIDFMR